MRNAKYCVFWSSIRENHNIFRYQQVRIRFNLLVRVSDSPDRNVSFLTAPNNAAVLAAYGFKPDAIEGEIVAALMKLYQQKVTEVERAEAERKPAKKRSRKKTVKADEASAGTTD